MKPQRLVAMAREALNEGKQIIVARIKGERKDGQTLSAAVRRLRIAIDGLRLYLPEIADDLNPFAQPTPGGMQVLGKHGIDIDRDLEITAKNHVRWLQTSQQDALQMHNDWARKWDAWMDTLTAECDREAADTPAIPQLVTLLQMAGLVQRSKRTLETLKRKGKLPPPVVAGGDGKAAEWEYAAVRQTLEAEFGRRLPAELPSLRPT